MRRQPSARRSTKPARIAENFAVFDFELTDAELAAITLESFGREIPEA